MSTELHSLVLDKTYNVPAAQLYAALADPVKMWAGVPGARAEADVRVGGSYRVSFPFNGSTVTLVGEVRTHEPGSRIVLTVNYDFGTSGAYADEYIEFLLQPSGSNQTDLLMAHCWRGHDRPADARKGFQKMWTVWLTALQTALEASVSPRDRFLKSLESGISVVLFLLILTGFLGPKFFDPGPLLIRLYTLVAAGWAVALLAWLSMRFLPQFQFTLRQLYIAILTLQLPMALLLMSSALEFKVLGGVLMGLWASFLIVRIYTHSLRARTPGPRRQP